MGSGGEKGGFSGYAQRDPLIEYQDQGFRRFQQLIASIQSAIVRMLMQANFAEFAPRVIQQLEQEEEEDLQTNEGQIEAELTETGVGPGSLIEAEPKSPLEWNQFTRIRTGKSPSPFPLQPKTPASSVAKVGRNDPCPCGSGKKFKKCHGKDS